jgi:hypothetical protein
MSELRLKQLCQWQLIQINAHLHTKPRITAFWEAFMTHGEQLYLYGVVIAFAAFALTVLYIDISTRDCRK